MSDGWASAHPDVGYWRASSGVCGPTSRLVPCTTRGPSLLCVRNLTRTDLGHEGFDFSIGGETTGCLLRVGNTVVDTDLKCTPARALQHDLRLWSQIADEVRRRTGARFIVSLAAVVDFDAHQLHPLFVSRQP